MFDSLERKLNYEYRRFYEEKRRASKENIFGSSYEIETKKTIVRVLKETKFDYQEEQQLLRIPDLIDNVYALMEQDRQTSAEDVRRHLESLANVTEAR